MSCCRWGLKEVWDLWQTDLGHPVICICDCEKGYLRHELYPHWEKMNKTRYSTKQPEPEYYSRKKCEKFYFPDCEMHKKQIEEMKNQYGESNVRNWYKDWKKRQKL